MVTFLILYKNLHGTRVTREFHSITSLSEFMQELVIRGEPFTVEYNL